MAKTPFDMSEMMKAFEPEALKKMFDPQNMMAMMQPPKGGAFDMSAMIASNKRQFEAMAEANKAAAEGYQDMLKNQMAIFQEAIDPAKNMLAEATDPKTIEKRTEQMNAAVEQALGLMKKLAESTKAANEQAFADFKAQFDEAMKKIKS